MPKQCLIILVFSFRTHIWEFQKGQEEYATEVVEAGEDGGAEDE